MSKYGHCADCGAVMQSPSICTNCDEEAMIVLQEAWDWGNE